MKIWVDDVRPAPDGDWDVYLNSYDTIQALNAYRLAGTKVDLMSLDHDLGGEDTSRRIVLWMCNFDYWPVEVRVHSANPVGVEWLEGMIDRYKP